MEQEKFARNLRITQWLIALAFVLPVAGMVLGFDTANYRLTHEYYTTGHLVGADEWHKTFEPLVSQAIKLLWTANSVALIVFSTFLKNTVAKGTGKLSMVLGVIGVALAWLIP